MKKIIYAFMMVFLFVSSANAATKFRFAHGEPEKNSYGIFADMFAANIAEISKGAMACQVFPNGVIGSETEAGQKVKGGTLQMAILTAANAGQFSQSLNVLTFPYMFSGPEDLMGETGYLRSDSPFREKVAEKLLADAGTMRLLAIGTNTFRLLFTKKPVTKLEDLKGIKVRIATSPALQRTWETWGASPYPLAWSETFTAVQQGVMDAFECPTNILLYNGFYPYTNHVAENLYYCPQIFLIVVSERWYSKLSDQEKAWLSEAAVKTEAEHFAWISTEYDDVKKQLLEHDVQFHQITDVDQWKEKAVALWPDFVEFSGGKEWVDSILKFKDTGSFE